MLIGGKRPIVQALRGGEERDGIDKGREGVLYDCSFSAKCHAVGFDQGDFQYPVIATKAYLKNFL